MWLNISPFKGLCVGWEPIYLRSWSSRKQAMCLKGNHDIELFIGLASVAVFVLLLNTQQ
jgi:hypothetical protein